MAVDLRVLVITASIGIAIYADDGDSAAIVLRNADIALHHAKEVGGGNIQFFAKAMNVAARGRLDIEASMRVSLERDEFVVHYQPQVDLATGALSGYEALVRWRHPTRGLIAPGEFIPIAESTGLIVPLGQRVLEIACRDAARWQRAGEAPVPVAVNVTARQFRQKGFVTNVRNALDASGLDPSLLELEIIEDAIMDHGVDTVAALDAIGTMGVQLAIDDFGTGYSSLSYLKRLPIDTVKIDQSFVADLPDDPGARAIVGSIIALAHNLGLEVIAEGVETEAQLAYLRQTACNRGQGFLFGRPLAVELLASHRPKRMDFVLPLLDHTPR
jgi:EAL domain-containing protein (putative c-di-GMP-specific phosphodiesterase class I)